jgi:hypothetical protein
MSINVMLSEKAHSRDKYSTAAQAKQASTGAVVRHFRGDIAIIRGTALGGCVGASI